MMRYPERFSNLPEYAFPRLRGLLDVHPAGGAAISMTIGEPRHPIPDFVAGILAAHIVDFGKYPANDGTPELLTAIHGWLARRYGIVVGLDQIMALNGTREGLFNAALALCPEAKNDKRPAVLLPNPFYQAYALGALTLGAEPIYVPATRETAFLPDYASLPSEVLNRAAIAFICSPSNPQGAIADESYLSDLLHLAEKHDFQVFADECYAELYRDTPPPGALQIATQTGADPERVLIFHSLSKRSNMPGLRSGFVAGGSQAVARIRQLRAYGGAPLPLPIQHVSAAAWNDEAHVVQNRALYAAKYNLAEEILGDVSGYQTPAGGFFLWLPVPDGEAAALKLWRETGVRVLPGAYLSRDHDGQNPGRAYVRVALVAPFDETKRGLIQLRACLYP